MIVTHCKKIWLAGLREMAIIIISLFFLVVEPQYNFPYWIIRHSELLLIQCESVCFMLDFDFFLRFLCLSLSRSRQLREWIRLCIACITVCKCVFVHKSICQIRRRWLMNVVINRLPGECTDGSYLFIALLLLAQSHFIFILSFCYCSLCVS